MVTITRGDQFLKLSIFTNSNQPRLGELESDDLRYNRTKRGSDKSDEGLYRETSGRRATRDNEINISSTFEHSIRRLDAQTNDTLPLDDSFGELGDDRRHPSKRTSGRGETRGANDSSIQAGVLGEGYSLRGRSEEIKRDGQYGY